MKRAIIVHGWEGHPEEAWFPWLKKELEAKGFSVNVPAMPDTEKPVIEKWVSHLANVVGTPDEDLILIGHSIGCQTIMRYLETLPDDAKVKQVIFVAGWFTLTLEAAEDEEDIEIARPWIETPIDFEKVKKHTDNFTAIFSDDEPYVPIENKELFEESLNAKIVMEHGKGHMNDEKDVKELPSILEAIYGKTEKPL